MNQEKNLQNGASDINGENETNNVFTASTAPTQEMPKTATANAKVAEANATETQNAATNVQEPASNANVTVETPKKKKGLGSRIVHSKDSMKLIGALAFCAVFATCTLLAVTVFDKLGHLGDKGADIRMEQRADSDRGNMPDMGSNDRFNGNGDFNGRGNKPGGNATAPDGAQPNDGSNSSDENAQSDENRSEDANSANNGKLGKGHHGNVPDSQNGTDESSKNESSSNSTAAHLA